MDYFKYRYNLNIYFGSNLVEKVETNTFYTLQSLIGEAGGTLGSVLHRLRFSKCNFRVTRDWNKCFSKMSIIQGASFVLGQAIMPSTLYSVMILNSDL